MCYIVAYLSPLSIHYHAKPLELCSEHTFKNSSTSPLRRTYISCVPSLKSRMISGSFDWSPAITIDNLDACFYMNMYVYMWLWNCSRSAIHSMTVYRLPFTAWHKNWYGLHEMSTQPQKHLRFEGADKINLKVNIWVVPNQRDSLQQIFFDVMYYFSLHVRREWLHKFLKTLQHIRSFLTVTHANPRAHTPLHQKPFCSIFDCSGAGSWPAFHAELAASPSIPVI